MATTSTTTRDAAPPRVGDAVRYHLFTAEQELRKARDSGSAQAAAVAQLHALQLGAALDGGGGGGGGRETHHPHAHHPLHHSLATAPLRAEAASLELAARTQHEAASGRALAVVVGAAADQADAADAARRRAAGTAQAPAAAATTRRARIARALAAAADFGRDDDDDEDNDENDGGLRQMIAGGARAWELSARLEAATAAWEGAQAERRQRQQQEQQRRRQQQGQQKKQARPAGAAPPPVPPPRCPPNAPAPPPDLAARWGGSTADPAPPPPHHHHHGAKRARRANDDDDDDGPVELGGDGISDDDDPDANGDEWLPGGRGARGGRWQQQQQHQQQHQAAPASVAGGVAPAALPNAAAAPPPPPAPPAGPFQTARLQLVADLRRKGQHQQAAALQQPQAPRPAGLRRGANGNASSNGNGNGGNGNGAQGFVPPFVSKALDSVCNGNGGGSNNPRHQQQQQGQNNNGNTTTNNNEQQDGPLTPRTLELLRVPSAADLPPELARHEPRLLELVCSEVVDPPGAAGVAWDDIAGLATVKALVKEIVVWPMLNPSIFTGARAPPRGLLLFGPPGTGKTLVGRAIASQTGAAFFSISASSLTSKWIGEGEKLVRALFAVAAHVQPSVIFVDEVDSLLSARKAEGEHEASRRLKTELLVQMEGCDPSASARRARVLLVGATNRPEELDEAARRRMPKQLYIPLPCAEARRQMLERSLLADGCGVASALGESDVARVVERTAGYSGSDMRALIQEACQGPVRDAVAAHGERVAELSAADLRPVVRRDFAAAARAARASVGADEVARYEAYDARHGARYVARRGGAGLAGGGGEGEGGGGGEEGGAGGEGAHEDDDDW